MSDDELTERIAASLKKQRIAAGYSSYKAFAEVAGMAPARYYGYESGSRGLKVSDACKIADILGITLDELVGRDFRPEHESSGFDALPIEEAKLIMDWRSLDDRGRETVESVMDVQLATGDLVPEEKNEA